MDDTYKGLLQDIIRRLDIIDDKLDLLQKGNVKLGTHIDLVENVADIVREPIRKFLKIDLHCFRSINPPPPSPSREVEEEGGGTN